MDNIEKVLTELREALEVIRDSCTLCEGKPRCLRCRRAVRALAAFTAEMPGAIGRVMRNPEHEAICATGHGPGRECDCGLDAALAKLEGKT